MISLVTEYFLAIALFFSFITLIFYGFPVAWTMGGLGVLFIFISMISDNLFDITHLSYVHLTSIGTDAIVDFPAKTERYFRSIKMSRLVTNRPPAPFYQKAGKFVGNVAVSYTHLTLPTNREL